MQLFSPLIHTSFSSARGDGRGNDLSSPSVVVFDDRPRFHDFCRRRELNGMFPCSGSCKHLARPIAVLDVNIIIRTIH